MANKPLDTALLDRAIIFATNAHAGTERRGKGFPYIVHPLEAVEIVATITPDQELLAAAALHDTVEDTDITIEDIRKEFGDRVADLVEAESDKFTEGVSEEASWHERKKAAIDRLAAAPHDAKIVAMGDKLSNMRAIYRDYVVKGDELWKIFHAKDKKDHEWHYRGLADSLSELSETFAYKEFAELIDKVFGEKQEFEEINMADYEQSGDGFTAISYFHKDGTRMIKLYSDFIPSDVPVKEYTMSRKIESLGLRIPKAYRLVTDGKRLGVEFERIQGKKSFARAISDNPERLEFYAVDFARQARKLHGTPCDTSYFTDAKDFFREQVDKATKLSEARRAWFRNLIDTTPDCTTCLHGDLHHGNMITNGPEDFWIDLADFRYGHPYFDLGMIYFATQCIGPERTESIYHMTVPQMREFWKYFAKTYFDAKTDEQIEEAGRKILPYAALLAIYYGNRQDFIPELMNVIDAACPEK